MNLNQSQQAKIVEIVSAYYNDNELVYKSACDYATIIELKKTTGLQRLRN